MSLKHGNSLLISQAEQAMATHSNVLAWRVLWTEEPGGLLSVGSHRVGHDWSDLACMHVLEKEMAYSCLENPRDGGAWWAAAYGVIQSQTQLKRLSSSSSSKSEDLKWINNDCKSNSPSYGKSKKVTWLFLAPWQTSFFFFFWWDKAFPGFFSHLREKNGLKCVFHLGIHSKIPSN